METAKSDASVPAARVDLTEEEIAAVVAVLRSGQLREGQRCREFEERFAEWVGAKYAVAVSSGTAALHIAYACLLEPGDEVLVPAFTFVATASMLLQVGARPIFCDIDPHTFTLDSEDARRRISPRARAIAPVHLFGNSCDIAALTDLAGKYGLSLIWDAAQAHGTKYRGRDVGSFGNVACYSFYPTKNMTTGEGGMVVTDDPQLYERARLLRSHGQERKYYHTLLGFNYRMTDFQAAIGLAQLAKVEEAISRRRANGAYLTERLTGVRGIVSPFVADGVEHSFNQYSILLNLKEVGCSRDEFVSELQRRGVEAAVHYPIPLHRQPVFQGIETAQLPVSEDVSQRILSLPVHPALSQRELDRVVEAVTGAAKRG